MSLAVVNSGGANISSVLHALRRLGAEPRFTSDAGAIQSADRVILPGVGAAGSAMETLRSFGLVEVIRKLKQPVLGICLGMQLLFDFSAEDETSLLGMIPARLERLPDARGLRIPHMGWNAINNTNPDPLTSALDRKWFYFVHSFAAPVGEWTLSTSRHGQEFSAIVRKDNFYGTQFHPERSAGAGAELLRKFLQSESQ